MYTLLCTSTPCVGTGTVIIVCREMSHERECFNAMVKKSGFNSGEVMNTFLLQIVDNSCACLEFCCLELPNVPLNQFNTTYLLQGQG